MGSKGVNDATRRAAWEDKFPPKLLQVTVPTVVTNCDDLCILFAPPASLSSRLRPDPVRAQLPGRLQLHLREWSRQLRVQGQLQALQKAPP